MLTKLIVGVAVVLAFGISVYVLQKTLGNGARSNLTDAEIAQDLALLEKAVWDYGRLLPENLHSMKTGGLKGNVQDYDYHLTQQYEGGPGEAFALCATFHYRSQKIDDPGFQYYYYYNSPEAYTYHSKGKQCFHITWNIHGGASSITIMEKTPDWAER